MPTLRKFAKQLQTRWCEGGRKRCGFVSPHWWKKNGAGRWHRVWMKRWMPSLKVRNWGFTVPLWDSSADSRRRNVMSIQGKKNVGRKNKRGQSENRKKSKGRVRLWGVWKKKKVETYLGERAGGGIQHVWAESEEKRQSCKEKHVLKQSLSQTWHTSFLSPCQSKPSPPNQEARRVDVWGEFKCKTRPTWQNNRMKLDFSSVSLRNTRKKALQSMAFYSGGKYSYSCRLQSFLTAAAPVYFSDYETHFAFNKQCLVLQTWIYYILASVRWYDTFWPLMTHHSNRPTH